MPIEFRCTQCHKLLRVPDDTSGRSSQCPQCGTLQTVPDRGQAEGPQGAPAGPDADGLHATLAPGEAPPPSGGHQQPAANCPYCAELILANAVKCKHCGSMLSAGYGSPGRDSSKRILAGVLAILLGSLGIHKFVLGLTTPGVIMLLLTLCTCGFGGAVMGVIGLVEGIIYLTKSDEEFYQCYIVEQRGWF